MKNKKIFKGPISFLIVAVIAIMAFTEGSLRSWLTLGALAITGLWFVIPAVWTAIKKRKQKQPKKLKKKRRVRKSRASAYACSDKSKQVSAVLLRHVNYRISEYLKSAFPHVAWEWISLRPEKLAAEGGTGRIRLFNVPEFNYADVVFNQMARIDCDFLRVVPLAELKTASEGSVSEIKSGQAINPAVWYSIQGKATLESCVADLHSRGFSALTIRENGEIFVKQGNNDISYTTLRSFPEKKSWPSLADVLNKTGLKASVLESCIAVSW